MPSKLPNFLEIENESFGKVKIYYYIRTVNKIKLLRYKIDECPGLYDIVYSELEHRNVTLHEYFRNVLKFLNLQLAEFGSNSEFREDMDPEDNKLFDYLEKLKNERNNG